MKGFNLATSLRVGRSPWTSRNLRGQARPMLRHIKSFSTSSARKEGPGGNGRGRVLLLASGGTVAAGAVFLGPVQHVYEAAERTGRVVSTLAVCINE